VYVFFCDNVAINISPGVIDMEVRTGDNEVRIVKTLSEEFDLWYAKTAPRIHELEKQGSESTRNFSQAEKDIIAAFKEGAGLVTAALLHTTSKDPSVIAQVKEIQQSSDTPLKSAQRRTVSIRLLCGLILYVTTLYCPPDSKGKPRDKTEARTGLYPELAAYGFAKKSSAAFEELVARRVAFYPSFELATQELNREGIDINVKEVRRIALQFGEGILAMRLIMVQDFFEGTLPTSDKLAGKRVVVSSDGGRMKFRRNKVKNRKSKSRHPQYYTDWREPKLFIIYTIDEHGKKEEESRVWIDGTCQGPDHLAELLAAKLYHLGISQAECITFIADGAPWIWDRFDWLVEVLKLPKAKVQCVLDFYHAAHHISLALRELSLSDDERRKVYKELRGELKNSRWQFVIDKLKELGADLLEDESNVFCRELRFFAKHGKAKHLNYATYKRRGLPLGSGAVESAIRRVINLRLKGNGMFWTEENAESMLQVRCQIMSTEWDVVLDELYHHRLKTRRRKWQWQAGDHSRKAKSEAKPAEKN
jgi:hypothetical protein